MGGVSNRVLRKLKVNWMGILGLNIGLRGNIRRMAFYHREGVGICSTTELGKVQSLLAGLWHLIFLWTSLLSRSGVGMTGISRRNSQEITGTLATWTLE